MNISRGEGSDWLEGFLFDRRIAVARGPLDDALATRLASELMTLDATGDEPVTLQLDSPGGTLSAAFTVIDIVGALGVPVHVLCMGRVEGVAVAVAAAGTRRLSLPHTQFRTFDPDVSFEARASQAEHLAASQLDLVRRYHESLARSTGHSAEEVEKWCSNGHAFGAVEALARGIIDEISRGQATLRSVH